MLNKKNFILIIVLILGLGLRLYSINYGLPNIFGPDEKRQVLDALSMGSRHSLVPLEYTYPALHKYLLLFCFSIYLFLGLAVRMFSNISDFVFKFLVAPQDIFLIARLLSVFFGVAIVIPVYLLGKNFFSKDTGISACIFAMFMFALVSQSQWATSDILLTFWSTWAFYYILRCMESCQMRDFILSGVFIGLAAATKYQGLYLIAPFLATFLINPKSVLPEKKIKMISVSFLVMLVFIMLGNLGFIFSFKENAQRLLELKNEIMGISSSQPFNHNFISVIAWFIKELIRQETLLGFILVVGILYSIYRHTKKDLAFLIYLTFCLAALIPFGFRSLHLFGYIFAIICVFGASFVERLTEIIFKARYRFAYSLIFASIIVLPSIGTAIQSDIKRSHPDTRVLAKAWVEKSIPFGSNIAEDWFDFSVPLRSDYPLLFQDEKISSYYLKYFDANIRQRYRDYSFSKGAYRLTQARYETEEPDWPKDMPQEAIGRAEKIPLIKRLYRWFNFRSTEDLKKMGVTYIIISSYAYNHFLLDDDHYKKTGLFNPYFSEDTLSSNKQARVYNKNSRYGLLFYLAKRARGFYSPLLNSENKNIKIVKEFSADNQNLGPVIKIYKLED